MDIRELARRRRKGSLAVLVRETWRWRRVRRHDRWDKLMVVLAGALALLILQPIPPSPEQIRATSGNPVYRLSLTDPALPIGVVAERGDPVVTAWLSGDKRAVSLRGQLDPGGKNLNVRPWLYTTIWIPQPVVPVQPDGTFQAVVYLDTRYESPVVINLEVEDAPAREVVASYNIFVNGRRDNRGGCS